MLTVNKTQAPGMLAVVGAVATDQVTKAWVVASADTLRDGIAVFPGFNLTFHRNDGVTFGLFGGAPWWGLLLLALAICVWLTVMMLRAESSIEAFAFGAIIGGALGNVVDRIHYGAVTDFLDFFIGSAHWPTFNMADVFIVGGAGLLLVAPVIQRRFGSDQ
jgi:signal peptidase II